MGVRLFLQRVQRDRWEVIGGGLRTSRAAEPRGLPSALGAPGRRRPQVVSARGAGAVVSSTSPALPNWCHELV